MQLLGLFPEDYAVGRAAAYALAWVSTPLPGRLACIEAGVPAALVALAARAELCADGTTVDNLALAIDNVALSKSDDGKAACVAAGMPQAVAALAACEHARARTKAATYLARR